MTQEAGKPETVVDFVTPAAYRQAPFRDFADLFRHPRGKLSPTRTNGDPLSMNYIDAHVHVWTPDTAHYKLAAGFTKDDMKPPSFTPQDLFKHSKPAGVTRINLIQMSYYRFENEFT
jgi:hypothetical protein